MASLFLSLPPEVVGVVAGWLELDSLVSLAACCRELRQSIFGNQLLWRAIDFGGVSDGRCACLTDDMLGALLQHVRAASVTRVLSIRGCVLIEGPGLVSLTASPVLVSIDLRKGKDHHMVAGPTGLDDEMVAGILTSMLQPPDTSSVLREIKMRRTYAPTYSPTSTMRLRRSPQAGATDWIFGCHAKPLNIVMARLRAALGIRMAAAHTKCGFCQDELGAKLNPKRMGTVASLSCIDCGRSTCALTFKKGTHPTPTECSECPVARFCERCEAARCPECWSDLPPNMFVDQCDPSLNCQYCHKNAAGPRSICPDCMDTTECGGCFKDFSKDCSAASQWPGTLAGTVSCDGCGTDYCEDCVDGAPRACQSCRKAYCEECCDARDDVYVGMCDGCQCQLCHECNNICCHTYGSGIYGEELLELGRALFTKRNDERSLADWNTNFWTDYNTCDPDYKEALERHRASAKKEEAAV